MQSIKTILAACDLSKYTETVLDTAYGLATRIGADLFLVNVINQRDIDSVETALEKIAFGYESVPISLHQYHIDMQAERLQSLREIFEKVAGKDRKCNGLIKVGVPFKAIIETIHERQADMLVIGTKGRSNLSGVLLGSTAEKLFRHCPVPLLSVRIGDRSRTV